MGRQLSAGKLVLILDTVHSNLETPLKTLLHMRWQCGKTPPYRATRQLWRVSWGLLIKPQPWCLAFQLVNGSFYPRLIKKE